MLKQDLYVPCHAHNDEYMFFFLEENEYMYILNGGSGFMERYV